MCTDLQHGHGQADAKTGAGARLQVVGDLRQTPKGWFLVPVGQLTTQQREYTALHRAAATEVPLLHIVFVT